MKSWSSVLVYFAFLSFLAMSSPPAAAQVQTFDGQTFTDDWTAELSAPGGFGRTAHAELTGDGLQDCVLIDGAQAMLLVGPDTGFAPVSLPIAANDICTLPGHLSDGRGAIAIVNGSGLAIGTFVEVSGTIATTPTASGAWAGARRVTPIDLDTAGRLDLAGVAYDNRTVLFATAGAAECEFFTAPGFVAAGDVLDLLALQWISGGAQEIALLTTAGVFVHTVDGTQLASFSSALAGGTIARIRQQGAATDRLTWITTYSPPSPQWLFTLAPSGVQGQVDVGELDIVSSTGADFDCDGDDDLLVSHRYAYSLVYFENQRSPSQPNAVSFNFNPDRMRLFRVANTPAPENLAWPSVADYDGDLDLDIVFPCESEQRVRYMRGDWIDQDRLRPRLISGTFMRSIHTVTLKLDAPLAVVAPTHLQVGIWYQINSGSLSEREGVDYVTVPWPTSWPAYITFHTTGLGTYPTQIHSAHIRGVTVGLGGTIAGALPAYVGSMTRDSATAADLADDPYASPGVPLTNLEEDPTLPVIVVGYPRPRRYKHNKPPAKYLPQPH
jgi:hypothetical protein